MFLLACCSLPHLAGHQLDWRGIVFCWVAKSRDTICVNCVPAGMPSAAVLRCMCKALLLMHSLCSLCIVHANPSNLSRFSAVRAGVAVLQLPRYTMVFQHHTLGLLPLLSSANTRLLLRHRSCACSAFSNSTQPGRAITALAPKPITPASVPQSTPTIHYSPDPLSIPLHRSPLEMQGRHWPQHCGLDRRQQPSAGQQVSVH